MPAHPPPVPAIILEGFELLPVELFLAAAFSTGAGAFAINTIVA